MIFDEVAKGLQISVNTNEFYGDSTGAPDSVSINIYEYQSGSTVNYWEYDLAASSGVFVLDTLADFVDATYLISIESYFDDGSFTYLGFLVDVKSGIFRKILPFNNLSVADYDCPNLTYSMNVENDGFTYNANLAQVIGFDPNTGDAEFSILSTDTSDSVQINPIDFEFDGQVLNGFFGGFLFEIEATEFPDLPSSMGDAINYPLYFGMQWIGCD